MGRRATFGGTLQCDASIRIDGAVEQGRIVTPANVIITETANASVTPVKPKCKATRIV